MKKMGRPKKEDNKRKAATVCGRIKDNDKKMIIAKYGSFQKFLDQAVIDLCFGGNDPDCVIVDL